MNLLYSIVLCYLLFLHNSVTAQQQYMGWGVNTYGQLGNGSTVNSNTPLNISNTIFTALSAGENHVLAIKPDGSLWAWGLNNTTQLGNGTNTNSAIQLSIYTGQWTGIAAGGMHSVGILNDGSLWTWGLNTSYQLGDGTYVGNRNIPTKISNSNGNPWKNVSAGYRHTIAIREDGGLWSWGLDTHQQLGDGGTGTGRNYPSEISTANGNKWVAIAAGYEHNIALREDGSLWGWGSNISNQLGQAPLFEIPVPTLIDNGSTNKWIRIAAGQNFSVAVRADGSLWYLGKNAAPAILDNGYCIKWADVKAGHEHIVAVKEDGTIWTWGKNTNGELGLGDNIDRDTPTLLAAMNYFNMDAVLSAGKSFTVFSGNKITAPLVTSNATSMDMYVCIKAGDLFNYQGTSYTTQGVYPVRLYTTQNCDSIVNLHLQVTNPVTRDSIVEGCTRVMYNGKTYTADTDFRDTLLSVLGCDSIYYNVRIKIAASQVIILPVCLEQGATFTYQGQVLNQSGSYQFSYDIGAVCDSLVRVHLVIPVVKETSLNGFESVTYNGIRYTSSVVFTDTLKSSADCDSVYRKISITVQPVYPIVIPNIFSPNGDGINDNWVLQNIEQYPQVVILLYNRYGQLLKKWQYHYSPWDGRISGHPVPVGTYYYTILTVPGQKGTSGFVDIIR